MIENSSGKIIGIVGGAGPYAGLDLQRKILEQTIADKDQEHLTVISISQPSQLPDRTAYLMGETAVNPANAIYSQLKKLEASGASVAAIPCNTAHAPTIFNVVRNRLRSEGLNLIFLHMLRETADYISQYYPHIRRIGVLSTTGTYRVNIYPHLLETRGFTILVPSLSLQTEVIHPAIYNPEYGIKSVGKGTVRSRAGLREGIEVLKQQGAEAIILGCTEIPLAITETHFEGLPIIDPTFVLARALIREANPMKLKSLNLT